MKRRFLAVFSLLTVALAGCRLQKDTVPRTVVRVSVTASHNSEIFYREYTEYGEMEAVLNYLRLLDPTVPSPYAADTFRSDAYEIIVHYSDGDATTYHQIYHDYLKTNDGRWLKINAVRGEKLLSLLQSMPGDRI